MSIAPDVELILEQGGLKANQGAQTALFLAQAMGETEMLDSFLRIAKLRGATAEKGTQPFKSPDTDSLYQSGLILGAAIHANNETGENVHLPTELLYRHPHVLICGPAGTGKSFLIKHLTSQEMERGEVCWFIDSEGDFIDLAATLGVEKMWLMSYSDFRRNPFEPLPEEDPLVALGRVKTALRESGFMRDGSVNLLSELVHKLHTERNVFNGSESYPCFEDVYQEVKRSRFRIDSRRAQYAETLVSRLGNILDNMPSTYSCRKGFPITELASHSIVFDIIGLSRDLAHFFVDDLVLWLADYKLRSVRCGS